MKIVASSTLLAVMVWLVPLGVYIKPAQEQKTCGGQRAICLCLHQAAKGKPSQPGKPMLVTAQGSAHKEPAPSGAGNELLAERFVLQIASPVAKLPRWLTHHYSLLVSKSIEPVPKA